MNARLSMWRPGQPQSAGGRGAARVPPQHRPQAAAPSPAARFLPRRRQAASLRPRGQVGEEGEEGGEASAPPWPWGGGVEGPRPCGRAPAGRDPAGPGCGAGRAGPRVPPGGRPRSWVWAGGGRGFAKAASSCVLGTNRCWCPGKDEARLPLVPPALRGVGFKQCQNHRDSLAARARPLPAPHHRRPHSRQGLGGRSVARYSSEQVWYDGRASARLVGWRGEVWQGSYCR